MIRLLRSTLIAGALCLPTAALAQATPSSHEGKKHTGVTQAVITEGKDLKWGAAPAALPPGAKAVVLDGDPAKPGAFTLRVKLPANYRIAPHYHPEDERVTIISGTGKIGMGERFEASKMTALEQGGYFSMPKGHRHFFEAAEDTVIQLNGLGPWDIIYVNPADDPRQQKGQAKRTPGSAP